MSAPRNIFKLCKTKEEKLLKKARGGGRVEITYTGAKIRVRAVSIRSCASKKQCSKIFKVLKEKNPTNLEFYI